MKKENQIIIRCLNKYGKVPETYELLEKIDLLEEENQRLNDDIKILFKENGTKEKVIIKYENVLNELEKMFDSGENFEDGCYCSEIEKYLHELKESDK